ncbi:hypothetical protein GOP47_0003695 [Adiantum capillus-veneris]|uniref:Uncharacterized protein n=1 Tax=Adiantum capillus-veneris TaxID=13818 RepID=A0A9D4ZNT3_ADICA|nr:hypothetical protein GOP47_0003695 [Adiantum capillus-veneris]
MSRASIRNIKALVAKAVTMDNRAGPQKVQMILAREMVLKAFTDDNITSGDFISEKEVHEMSQELLTLVNMKK